MLGFNAPTSDLLLRLLLLGLSRTSLKSSLRSASTRGILAGCGGRGSPGGGGGSGGPPALAPLRCTAPPAEPRRPKPAARARSVFIGRGERGAAARAPSLY